MKPFDDVNEAVYFIESYEGKASDMKLLVSDSLQDVMGINMSIITNKILEKGWEPDGYEEKGGYRIYLYKEIDGS